jgi:hypothetical protein
MKANYVRELNIKRIRRRISKIDPQQRMAKFSETLDPFQENFLSLIEGFWTVYRNCPNLSSESVQELQTRSGFVHQTTSDSLVIIGTKMKKLKVPFCQIWEFPENLYLRGLAAVKDMMNFQVLMMNIYLTSIPTIRYNYIFKPEE